MRSAAARRRGAGEPTILAAGPPLTSPGGHCYYLGGEVAGPGEIEAAVRERIDRGVDIVKVMASGGMATTGTDVMLPQFSLEELRLSSISPTPPASGHRPRARAGRRGAGARPSAWTGSSTAVA